ncbi:MAG: large-conductance mechanosensitive channel protein MscL [Tissierellales bacterium]
MLKEFKKFAMRGNVVDLAVGVIIGGAFGKIVTSLVNDIIMPLIGLILGGINLSSEKILLREAIEGVDALFLSYGQFLQSVLDFLIIAFSIFIFVKLINSFKKKEEEKPKPAEPSKEEVLLTEIRDLLREKR